MLWCCLSPAARCLRFCAVVVSLWVGAAQAAPFAYIANGGSNNVSVIDIATNTVVATVAVGNSPQGIAANPAGTRAYVTNVYSNDVSVIDTATNTVVATVAAGVLPYGIAVNPAGTFAYVTNRSSSGNVLVIDTATNTVVATVLVGADPEGVAVNPTGTRVYVANFGSNNVSVINTATNIVIATVAVGTIPRGVAVNPAGTRAYVANGGSNNVSVIDTATNTVIATVAVGSFPYGVAINPTGTRAYVTNYVAGNTVSVIDTATNTVVATVVVGNNPTGVAINPVGTRAYVANLGSNNISVIDTATNTVVATLVVGSAPVALGLFIASPTAPGAPTMSSATPGNGQATIYFTPPASNGGSLITGYTATCNPGALSVSGAASPLTVTALTNGTVYTCSVTATNGVGTGPASATVNVTPVTVPGAPIIGAATPGNAQASIAFSAPASVGGSAITGYTATCNPGALSVGGAASPLTVIGLTNGTVYTCSVTATNAVGTSAPSASVNVTLSAVTAPRLINLSTRGQVQTGDNVMIGGFIIGGSPSKTVLIRAVGPNLANFGVQGVLANPTLQLFSGQTVIASNDNWGSASNAAAIQASGLAPANALESAILVTLASGPYTAIVSGVGGATGVGIVEVFEMDNPTIPLINLSTRGQVLTGDNVLIGGFIIQGDTSQTVLIRAVGPNLANFGVQGVLANPTLQLFSGQTVIASNDDWGNAANAAAIQATGLAPANALESAILITLAPGAYTAIVSGVGDATGVGIVEVFAQ